MQAGLMINVDDTDAAYPITVDPLRYLPVHGKSKHYYCLRRHGTRPVLRSDLISAHVDDALNNYDFYFGDITLGLGDTNNFDGRDELL